MTIHSRVQLVTPEVASQWLAPAINKNIRSMRQDTVTYLAKEMTEGRWLLTHQGIAFADTGALLDGQHRLAAIVRAGLAVELMVTTGLPADAVHGMDCGLRRAAYDRIELVKDDEQVNRIICQAVRTFIYETSKNNHISVGEIEDEYLRRDKSWEWAARQFKGVGGKLRRAAIVASFSVYHAHSPAKAVLFLQGFFDGAGLPTGSPVLKLRNSALTGTVTETGYWRCQALMRAHSEDKTLERVYEAAEDLLGNENKSRIIKARSDARREGAVKRYAEDEPA